jgi:serine protease Do
MKSLKVVKIIPILVIFGSLLLTACSGINFDFSLPQLTQSDNNTPIATVPALPTVAPTTSTQSSSPTAAQPQKQPVSSAPATQAQTQTQSQTPLQVDASVTAMQNAFQNVYSAVNPSVVTIQISAPASASSRNFGFGGQGNGSGSGSQQVVPTAEGSGFVWDMNGHIVTNNHVVEGASVISVTFADGKTATAKLTGTDPNSDLAVIQVNVDASELHPVNVGDSTKVVVGQMVVAIGNPFGLGNTMTTGIVSAISRSIQAGSSNSANSGAPTFSIPDVIQTDAAINPGNSGGVLVDLNGLVIGVPSQIESASGSNSGVGFAIPSAVLKKVVPSLIQSGSASHSYLGISGTTLTADINNTLKLPADTKGVLVVDVVANGPAAKAGVAGSQMDANGNPTSAGDVITAVDGKTVTRFEDLVSYLFNNTQPGQVVTLTVLRDGKQFQAKVTLGTQPSALAETQPVS